MGVSERDVVTKVQGLPEMVGEPNKGGYSLVRRSDVLDILRGPCDEHAWCIEDRSRRMTDISWTERQEGTRLERQRIYMALVDLLWGCDRDAGKVG